MYVKILNEAIARKQQEDGQRHHKSQPVYPETKLDIDLDLFISENYIANANERMRFYHDLLLVESLPAFADITAEMEDRFGHMPQAMEHFIQAMRIRFIASRLLHYPSLLAAQLTATFFLPRHDICCRSIVYPLG
jgi:transcription-repair coupling factor (superfamily II helicase)